MNTCSYENILSLCVLYVNTSFFIYITLCVLVYICKVALDTSKATLHILLLNYYEPLLLYFFTPVLNASIAGISITRLTSGSNAYHA